MNDNQEIGCMPRLVYMIGTVSILVLLLCSCASTKQIEWRDREVEKWNTKVVHDTVRVYEKDSIYHQITTKNDTVFDTKIIERIRWRDKIVEKTDTIKEQQTVIEYKDRIIEKKIVPKWCWYCLAFSILCFIFAIIKIRRN